MAKCAEARPAWGYRKIAAIAVVEGCEVGSPSSVKRAMARCGLLQPLRQRAERRQFAAARREVLVDPHSAATASGRPTSASSSPRARAPGGCGVLDCATKVALACPITLTRGATDLLGALQAAIDTAEAPIGRPLAQDCADARASEIAALLIVTDNGPAMKSRLGWARGVGGSVVWRRLGGEAKSASLEFDDVFLLG